MEKGNKFVNVRVTARTFEALRKITNRTGEKQYRAVERVVVTAEKNERRRGKD